MLLTDVCMNLFAFMNAYIHNIKTIIKMMSKKIFQLLIVLYLTFSVGFVLCQEETTVPATTKAEGEEEEEEEPQKKGCSIWCWIQKIAMFVISQLLSGNFIYFFNFYRYLYCESLSIFQSLPN